MPDLKWPEGADPETDPCLCACGRRSEFKQTIKDAFGGGTLQCRYCNISTTEHRYLAPMIENWNAMQANLLKANRGGEMEEKKELK